MSTNSYGNYLMMPIIVGPERDGNFSSSGSPYREVQSVALSYETDPDALRALVPSCYEIPEPAIITVSFIQNNGVDFMAGGGYRIATVLASVEFNGEKDHEKGNYVLVMFEDDTLPILLGRERLGVAKLFADISPIRTMPNGHIRCETSLWGHPLFGIDVEPLTEQSDEVIAKANETPRPPMLSYKYIPSLEGPPDEDYPVCTRSEVTTKELSLGDSGRYYFGDPGTEDISFMKTIIDSLKTLPVRKIVRTSRAATSSVLRSDKARRLR
jgi:acetoacetate decarboxylase